MAQVTDVTYYSEKKGKRQTFKDCTLINNFVFSKNDFFTVSYRGNYLICYSNKGDLVMLWHYPMKNEYGKVPFGEAISEFKNGYIKNKITQEKIDEFINHPETYKK